MKHTIDYARSNLGPSANDNEPVRAKPYQPAKYGYQLWLETHPENDNYRDDPNDFDIYMQAVETGVYGS